MSGLIIYRYEIESSDGSGCIGASKRYDVKKLRVIGENEDFLVVDDHRFSTIKKTGNKDDAFLHTILGRPCITIHNADKCWGNRIWFSLFSSTPVKPQFIKRQIQKEIDRRFSYFTGKVDLSFIKEPTNDKQ